MSQTVNFLENLKGVLDYYIETRLRNHNIKLIRLKHRMGLIRARLQGAREAQGDVLIFLGECLYQLSLIELILNISSFF